MKNSKLTTLICGLIAIVATVILYLLTFDNVFSVPIRWISLFLLIIAECIVILKALFVQNNFISQTSIFTSGAHVAAVLILSIVFVNFFAFAFTTYILLNILMLCVLATVDMAILHISNSVSASNKKLAESQGVMDACFAKAQGLAIIYDQSDYKKDLIEIAEMIKYSDNSELTNDEATILAKLEKLETQLKDGEENISASITEIKNTIKLRTIKMQSRKRGSY